MESIQFGCMGFCMDISQRHVESPIRDFEEICIRSPKKGVDKIRSIENGTENYPIDSIRPMVNLTGQCFEDTVRVQLGLPELEETRSVWNKVV